MGKAEVVFLEYILAHDLSPIEYLVITIVVLISNLEILELRGEMIALGIGHATDQRTGPKAKNAETRGRVSTNSSSFYLD